MELPQDEPHIREVDSGGRDPLPEQPESNDDTDELDKQIDDGWNFFYCVLSMIVLAVGVTIIVVMLLVVKDDDDISGPALTPPPSQAPVTMLDDPQSRLNILLEAVRNDKATAPYLDEEIPLSANQLIGVADKISEDPIRRAASWVVHNDTYFAKHEIIERFALMSLWFTNGGANWIIKEGWASASSICDWEGVTCCKEYFPELDPHQCIGQDENRIVELDLHDNNLVGPIPAAIALLDACASLMLGNNYLTGELDPLVFSNMLNLDALYVQSNQMTGEISGSIRSNGKLDTLFTHGNSFTGDWPLEFCPSCKTEGLCVAPPISYSLDCQEMDCPPGCCVKHDDRNTCVRDGDA